MALEAEVNSKQKPESSQSESAPEKKETEFIMALESEVNSKQKPESSQSESAPEKKETEFIMAIEPEVNSKQKSESARDVLYPVNLSEMDEYDERQESILVEIDEDEYIDLKDLPCVDEEDDNPIFSSNSVAINIKSIAHDSVSPNESLLIASMYTNYTQDFKGFEQLPESQMFDKESYDEFMLDAKNEMENLLKNAIIIDEETNQKAHGLLDDKLIVKLYQVDMIIIFFLVYY